MSWWDLRRVSTLQGQVEPLNLEWMIYETIKLLLRMIWLWEWNSLAWMICPTFAELKIQVSGCPWLCRKSDFIMFPHLFASPGLLAEKTRYLFLSLAASIHIVGSILSIHLCIENPYLSWKKIPVLVTSLSIKSPYKSWCAQRSYLPQLSYLPYPSIAFKLRIIHLLQQFQGHPPLQLLAACTDHLTSAERWWKSQQKNIPKRSDI